MMSWTISVGRISERMRGMAAEEEGHCQREAAGDDLEELLWRHAALSNGDTKHVPRFGCEGRAMMGSGLIAAIVHADLSFRNRYPILTSFC